MSLRIYAHLPSRITACQYYRTQVPIRAMQMLNLDVNVRTVADGDFGNTGEQSAFFNADIVQLYQPWGRDLIDRVIEVKKFRPRRGRGGDWRWPPSVVVDTDDDMFSVHPLNPGFRMLGVRVNDKQIEPGEAVHWISETGETKVIWQEGFGGFNIDENLGRIEGYRELLGLADSVTCTTPRSAAYVVREQPKARPFIWPNCVMESDYPSYHGVSITKKNPNEIRILWQGSNTHHEDLVPLRHAISHLSRKYPQIRWVFWGALYAWIVQDLPSSSYECHPWVPFEAYHTKLGTILHDIAIAPLSATTFNASRSAIKMYESAALANPAPLVAQGWGAYPLEIKDGKTGMLFADSAEFIQKIGMLVENETLRRQIAANAKDWVMENRNALKEAPKLFEHWVGLRETMKQAMPPTPEDDVKTEDVDGMNGDRAAEDLVGALPAE